MKKTSLEAYQYAIPTFETIRQAIYEKMEEGHLYSFRDLAMKTGLRESQVWKRLSEMRDKDKTIVEAGVFRCKITGRKVTAWRKAELKEN